MSKSKFVAGVQCLKRLYFQVHQPELAAEPDASDYAIMQQGREVGLLARQLFPGGVEVDGSGGLEHAIRTTDELVANPAIPAIFEGTFENGGVLVRVDILNDGEGLRSALETLSFPISYIDFETINPCIPRFAGMHAYQHLPFQWSAHVQDQPGAEPEHFEYISPLTGVIRAVSSSHRCSLRFPKPEA